MSHPILSTALFLSLGQNFKEDQIVSVIAAMAKAIAEQRRIEDRAMGIPIPDGGEFPYLPIDERAAKAALDAYNNFSGEK